MCGRSELNGDRYLSCWSDDFGTGRGEEREGSTGVPVLLMVEALIERGIGDWREDEERGNGR